MSERVERVAEARRLLDEGLTSQEIADHMGVAYQTVRGYFSDPDLAKQRVRRVRYSRPCPNCGRPMNGSGGLTGKKQPRACARCAPDLYRKWTREEVIRAIRGFADLYGRAPSATDFNPSRARMLGHEERAERFESHDEWPACFTVAKLFGTWNDAIRAAGFEPTPPGYYDRDDFSSRPEARVG